MKLTTKRSKKKADKKEKAAEEQYDILLVENGEFKTRLSKKYLNRKSFTPLNIKHVISAIPGTVTKIFIAEKAEINEGDVILELEAMKMHNKILSPSSGIIKAIYVKEGERVPKNKLMVEFE